MTILYNCKLSSDQRYLLFDCHESVSSSPAITPTVDAEINNLTSETKTECPENQFPKNENGKNVIHPVDLCKIIDVETHNTEKQGRCIY